MDAGEPKTASGDEQAATGPRDQSRRFVAGVSGNKAGRPVGVQAIVTRTLRDAIMAAANSAGSEINPTARDGVIAYLHHLAMNQPKTFGALLGRLVPLQGVKFPLPNIEKPSDAVAAANAVAKAMADGELSMQDASAVSTVIGNVTKAYEVHVLAERIAALEAATQARGAKQ